MPERGSILVLSIWALVTLSILGLGLSRITHSQLTLSSWLAKRAASTHLAEAAVRYARAERRYDETTYHTLSELGTVQKRELGLGVFEYVIRDEASRVNINTAPQAVLARIPGLGLDGAIAITESQFRPFHSVEEILFLEEVTEEGFSEFRNLVTVYGEGRININTAQPEVFAALGFDEDLVNKIRQYRSGEDGEEGTGDDGVFEEVGQVISNMNEQGVILGDQETQLLQVMGQGLLGVGSKYADLQIKTSVLDQHVLTYEVTLNTETGDIERWLEW